MLAVVGQAAAFDQGREQMKLLAGLELTTKAVERTAEAIGEDIGRREREQIQQAMQLDLPVMMGEPKEHDRVQDSLKMLNYGYTAGRTTGPYAGS